MNYFKKKEAVLLQVKKLKKFVDDLNLDTEELSHFEVELENMNFNVLCLGDFSSGKSTFINNFFLENKVTLPTRATTTTAKLTIIKYGKTLKILAVMKDKSHIEITENIEESLNNLVAAKGNQLEAVEFVEIQIPSSILKEGIVIVDSPGLNDPESERMDITYNFVNQADSVLYFLNASQAWKKSEKEFLEEKILSKEDLDKIFFLLNYWDIIENEDEREEILEYVQSEISTSVDIARHNLHHNDISNPPLIPISAKTGENFEILKKELFDYLINKKAENILNVKIHKYNVYIQNYLELITTQENLLKESTEALKEQANSLKKELEAYESKILEQQRKILRMIGNKYEDFINNLQYAYNTIIDTFKNEIRNTTIENIEDLEKYYQISLKKAQMVGKKLISEATIRFKREIEDIFYKEKSSLKIPYKNIVDNEFLETKILKPTVHYNENDTNNLTKIAGGAGILSTIGASGIGIALLAAPTVTTTAATQGAIAVVWTWLVGSTTTTVVSSGMSTLAIGGMITVPIAIIGGAGYLALKKYSKEKFQKELSQAIEESIINLQDMYTDKITDLRVHEEDISAMIAENISNEFVKAYNEKLDEYNKLISNENTHQDFTAQKEHLISLKI